MKIVSCSSKATCWTGSFQFWCAFWGLCALSHYLYWGFTGACHKSRMHFALFYSDFVVCTCSCTLYILYCIFGPCNCTKKSMIPFKMWHVIGWHPNCTTSHCFLSLGHVLFVWSWFTLVWLLVFWSFSSACNSDGLAGVYHMHSCCCFGK